MGQMKDFLITVHNGGDEAVAAVQRMGDDWRTMLEQAASEIEAQRLTVAEREAVEFAANRLMSAYVEERQIALTLRRLLSRSATSTREGGE